MSIIGIVCEFNPLHNGHKYLIDKVKKNKDDIIVAVMSGNFVQRGEPAIFPKDVRVEAALNAGVDIVLELPFLYATASAEIFAEAAVMILNSFGCDKIAFGTENSKLEDLYKTADVLVSKQFDEEIKKNLRSGVNYPTARQTAFNNYNINCNLSLPNNILAVEYVKAIRKYNYKITPIPVARVGAGYNDDFAIDNIASATHLRKIITRGFDFDEYVPQNIYEIYSDAIKYNRIVSEYKYDIAIMTLLRNNLNNETDNIANMAEGFENRIKLSIRNCTDLKAIYDSIKTKRYTYSRGRRAVLSMAFNITKEDLKIEPPYIRLLGFRMEKSKKLGKLAGKSNKPFVASYSDIEKIKGNDAKRVFNFENASTNIYNIALNDSEKCSTEMTYSPIKFKENARKLANSLLSV